MSERRPHMAMRRSLPRGYFAIGIVGGKTPANLGTLWRSAALYEASFIFTVGKRYPSSAQPSDTMNTPAHTPLFHFPDLTDLVEHLPKGCPLVGAEVGTDATPLRQFEHPPRSCYLLGAEDHGLRPQHSLQCHRLVQIESPLPWSMNVASAGAVLLYDRFSKSLSRLDHLASFQSALEPLVSTA